MVEDGGVMEVSWSVMEFRVRLTDAGDKPVSFLALMFRLLLGYPSSDFTDARTPEKMLRRCTWDIFCGVFTE